MKHLKMFNEIYSESELFRLSDDILEIFSEITPQLNDKLIHFDSIPGLKRSSFKREVRCWFVKLQNEEIRDKEFYIADIKNELLQIISIMKLKKFRLVEAKYNFNEPENSNVKSIYLYSPEDIEDAPDRQKITEFYLTFVPENTNSPLN